MKYRLTIEPVHVCAPRSHDGDERFGDGGPVFLVIDALSTTDARHKLQVALQRMLDTAGQPKSVDEKP